MKVYQDSLPYCCGVDDVGGFEPTYSSWRNHPQELQRSGTGLFTATFLNNEANKAKFEEMCKEHTLLYQSPVKRNRNSSNRLFLCVFQFKETRTAKQPKSKGIFS